MCCGLVGTSGFRVESQEFRCCFRLLYALARPGYGPDHADVGIVLTDLGDIYCDLGDHLRARELLERALVTKERSRSQRIDCANWAVKFFAGKARCTIVFKLVCVFESVLGTLFRVF